MNWKSKIKPSKNQASIYDQAERDKIVGMESAWIKADTVWKRRASEILQELINNRSTLTSEDIIIILENEGITTGNNRAIGSLMSAARKTGHIVPTGSFKQSRLRRRHQGPVRIWRTNRKEKA